MTNAAFPQQAQDLFTKHVTKAHTDKQTAAAAKTVTPAETAAAKAAAAQSAVVEEMDAEPAPTVAVGDTVMVHGLQGRAELNGQRGTLLSFDAGKNRWEIQLASERALIKPGTLTTAISEYPFSIEN